MVLCTFNLATWRQRLEYANVQFQRSARVLNYIFTITKDIWLFKENLSLAAFFMKNLQT